MKVQEVKSQTLIVREARQALSCEVLETPAPAQSVCLDASPVSLH